MLWIHQKHKNLDIMRAKRYSFFKQTNSSVYTNGSNIRKNSLLLKETLKGSPNLCYYLVTSFR